MELRSVEQEKIIYKLLNCVEIDKICRTCLSERGEMTSIFNTITDDSSTAQIREMISLLTDITIVEDDLPNQICMDCASRASVGYQFRLQTQKSDRILKELSHANVEKVMKLNNASDNEDISQTPIQEEIKSISDLDIVDEVIKEKTVENEIIDDGYKNTNIQNEMKISKTDDTDEKYDIKETATIRKRKRKNRESKTSSDKIEINEDPPNDFEQNNKIESDDHLNTISENDEDNLNLDELKKQLNDNKPKRPKDLRQDLFVDPNSSQICSVCSETLPNMNTLIKHRAQNHGTKKFQCQTCGNGFTTTRGLRIHLRLHTGEKPEICSICNKAFSDPRTLRNHERIHSGDQPFPCTECDKRFPARLPLVYHMRSHNGERPHRCHLCSKSYIQQNSLQIHLRTHTGEKPYVCKFCDKGFTNATSLSLHQLTHNGVKNFQCAVCGKRMARSGELTVHLRTHSGEKPYACAVCNKRFTNSSALRAHAPTHTGVKNFVCAVCGKRVARAMELRIHMRTHTGERNFACAYCDKRFATSSNLRLHERKHTGEKPYRCAVCSRAFADSHVLRNHARTHTGERPFECAHCSARFAQRASLNTHLKTHNDNKTSTKHVTETQQNRESADNPRQISNHEQIQIQVPEIQIQQDNDNNSSQIRLDDTDQSTNSLLINNNSSNPIMRNNLAGIFVDTTDANNMRQCLLIGESNDQHNIEEIQNDSLRQNELDFDTRGSIYTYSYQN